MELNLFIKYSFKFQFYLKEQQKTKLRCTVNNRVHLKPELNDSQISLIHLNIIYIQEQESKHK